MVKRSSFPEYTGPCQPRVQRLNGTREPTYQERLPIQFILEERGLLEGQGERSICPKPGISVVVTFTYVFLRQSDLSDTIHISGELFKTEQVVYVQQQPTNLEVWNHPEFCIAENVEENRQRQIKRKINPMIIPLLYPVAIMIGLFYIVLCLDGILPSAVSIADAESKKGNPFSSERTMARLASLTEIGPRIIGSPENSIEAVGFLGNEIELIRATLPENEKDRILISPQRSDGWYYLDQKPHGMLNTYEGIQNVVVKLVSKMNSSSSLLINCHFDSVPTSPGASDNGANCATMLELLRVLSEPDGPNLPHNLIYLFNGNEESVLQASHAFITQHEWAKEVQTFINLDAAGAGGREILFQTGPGNSWLIEAYAESVPYPSGNVIVEEIFQSGIFPSDTDFRIFRDFGMLPGLDIAYAKNGYVYHTKFDDISQIPLGTLQHTGENLLALIPRLMSSPEFSLQNVNGSKLSPVSLNDKAVYFDVLGLFIVNYSIVVALVLNILTLILSVITIFGSIFGKISSSTWKARICKIIWGSGKALTGYIIGAGIAILTAVVLDLCGHPMTWFTQPALIFPLFYCPTLVGCLLPYLFRSPNCCRPKHPKCKGDIWENTYMDILGVQLIWTAVILACIIIGIRSTYIFTFLVLFPTLAHFIVAILHMLKFHPVKTWVIMHQVFSLAPVALVLYYTILAFNVFVPSSGRNGPQTNPDLLVGAFAVILCLMAFSHIVPLMHLIRFPKTFVLCLFGIHILAVLLVTLSPIGFPYDSKETEPTPQRVQVLHVRSRQHQFHHTEPVEQHNLFWMIDCDRNGFEFSLPNAVNSRLISPQTCEEVLFCGMPVDKPRTIGLLPYTHVAPAPEPIINKNSELKLVSQVALSTTVRRLTFNVTGENHLSLIFSPAKGVVLYGWKYGEVQHATYQWKDDRPAYYMYHSIGKPSGEAWVVWIDLMVPYNLQDQSVVDVGLVAHYNHGDPALRATKVINDNLGPVPPWAPLVSWIATYDGWKF